MLAQCAVPIDSFLDRDGWLHRDRLANVILNVALVPVGKIVVTLAPLDSAMVVANSPERRLEFAKVAGSRGGKHNLAIRDAIEGIDPDDELLLTVRTADLEL